MLHQPIVRNCIGYINWKCVSSNVRGVYVCVFFVEYFASLKLYPCSFQFSVQYTNEFEFVYTNQYIQINSIVAAIWI